MTRLLLRILWRLDLGDHGQRRDHAILAAVVEYERAAIGLAYRHFADSRRRRRLWRGGRLVLRLGYGRGDQVRHRLIVLYELILAIDAYRADEHVDHNCVAANAQHKNKRVQHVEEQLEVVNVVDEKHVEVTVARGSGIHGGVHFKSRASICVVGQGGQFEQAARCKRCWSC